MGADENQKIHILLIDDDENEYVIIRRLFAEIGNRYEIYYINEFDKGIEEIISGKYDICLLDYRLGIHTGIEFIKEAQIKVCNTPIILFTGHGDHEVDIAAMKAGAADYIDKARLSPSTMERAIRYALERKKSEEKIKYLAYYDQLTNLPNRTLFMDHLNIAISTAERHNRIFSVMFIDIDNFKIINDTLGHSIGDKLIIEVANRLVDCIRKSDTAARCDSALLVNTVARMGGDEFTILLSEINECENASKVAERIQKILHNPVFIGENKIIITVSIGIAIFPMDGEDSETIIKHADLAMYKAKSLGKNNFQFYHQALNISAQKRLAMENDLYMAIEKNELSIYYQPIVNVKTRKIAAVEALLRWEHPVKGIILPADFLFIAEENGLIRIIGEQVFDEVGKCYQKWSSSGIKKTQIAVNISPKQLSQSSFIDIIKNVIQKYQMPPDSLTLEITENSIIQNIQLTKEIIFELKKFGIKISLDDFGIGYSSFLVLKQFPFNIIKIDRSFIKNVPGSKVDTTISSSIISIGHSLDLEVTAEGIENKTQLSLLESCNCDFGQGFYFSPPLPEEEIMELLKKE